MDVRPEVQTSTGLPSTPNDVVPSCALSLEEKASLAPLNKDPVLNPYLEIILDYVQIIYSNIIQYSYLPNSMPDPLTARSKA
jgi:hypothetical protein